MYHIWTHFQRLTKEPQIHTFNVSAYKIYELSFFIYSAKEESAHNPALISFDFDGRRLSEKEVTYNRLSVSENVGYFRYVDVSVEGKVYHKKLLIPRGVKQITIKLMAWKNRSELYISNYFSFERTADDTLFREQKELLYKARFNRFSKEIRYLEALYRHGTEEELAKTIEVMQKRHQAYLPELYVQLFHFFLDKSSSKAKYYARCALELSPDNKILRKALCRFYIMHGPYKKVLEMQRKEKHFVFFEAGRSRAEKIARRLGEKSVRNLILFLYKNFPDEEESIDQVAFSILKDIYPRLAIKYGKRYMMNHPENTAFAKVLLKRMERNQEGKTVYTLLKKVIVYTDDHELRVMMQNYRVKSKIALCKKHYENHEIAIVEKEVASILNMTDVHKSVIYTSLYDFFLDKSYERAKMFLQNAIEENYDERLIRNMYDLHLRYGHIRKALSVLPQNYTLEAIGIKQQTGGALLELLEGGAKIELPDVCTNYYAQKGKVLYLLHNRLPYNSGGYATRTHGLLTNIAKKGWDIHGVSRLGYPDDKIKGIVSKEVDVIDGIFYHRLHNEEQALGSIPMTAYLRAYAEALFVFAQKERPAFIHAASNHMNGLVGNAVAKALGIPSVYEVRGLWEITRISREPAWKDTDYYKLMVRLEAQAAKEADVVLTLTEALKREMISRGVAEEKIYIVPNGVTSTRFMPRKRDRELEKVLGVKGKCVVGYIGSVVAYEGLELLVDAVALLSERDIEPFVVLIVGDGAVLDDIKQRVARKGLDEYFIFTGRVPHEEVEHYYSLVDITPFPRRAQPVCEMVSPLKPFEAMAMEKAVLSSNVAALAEIVQDGYNGLLFEKESVENLAKKLALLISDEKLRKKLGKKAREWVKKERDWSHIAQRVDHLYHILEGEEDERV